MPSIAVKQGLISSRVEHLNNFRRVMGDIRIKFHALSQEGELIFNKKEYDHYRDTYVKEEKRMKKLLLISKYADPEYLQASFLMDNEDTLTDILEKQPFVVFLTSTDLPRLLNHDDQIVIGGVLYTVSRAAPVNRFNDSIQRLLVYPERNENGYNIL
jgi:hypothetical protein|nr:MAG TPA: hypothetical protein [Caudoviricetes sp.]